MTEPDSFPRQSARTRRFTLGEPRSVTIAAGGERLLFLRSLSGTDPRTALWSIDLPDGEERVVVDPTATEEAAPGEAERARRERVRETATGVVAYSADRDCAGAVFAAGGALHVVDVATGKLRIIDAARDAFDPRLDPTGARVGYVADRALCVVDVAGGQPQVLAVDDDEAAGWGRAEHVAAEEMNRFRGFWWAPDGQSLLATRVDESSVPTWWIADPAHPDAPPRAMRYPAAGSANAVVSLHHLTLDGGRREIRWDSAAFPYLARVAWSDGRPPLLQVQSRDQRRVLTLIADLADGGTTVVHDDADPVWVELFDGVPAWCAGDVVRIVDDATARRLFVGAEPVTSGDVYVRHVISCTDDEVLFTASYGDPTQVHVGRWHRRDGLSQLTTTPGVHTATASAGVVVVTSATLDDASVRHVVHAGARSRELRSVAQRPQLTASVQLLTVGARDLRTGLVLPREHEPGRRWPVLLSPYAGPHVQRVLRSARAWLEPQWLADQGFAVLVTDGRGTPGRSPEWDRAVQHAFAATLEDQVDALHAVAEVEPALDLDRVGIRGWSFGGWLAAYALLHRPDVFKAAVAGAPVADWAYYDTHYTERYLGLPTTDADSYARHSLIDAAASLSRPLLLIHGLADDNVVAAHTLLLSQRLTETGRAHAVLPLTGVTHMTPQEVIAENLLLLQVQFLRDALSR